MKKRAFRIELLAELRELVAVGRRLAAVAERERTRRDLLTALAVKYPDDGCNEFIHTRGPKEGQPITDEEQGR